MVTVELFHVFRIIWPEIEHEIDVDQIGIKVPIPVLLQYFPSQDPRLRFLEIVMFTESMAFISTRRSTRSHHGGTYTHKPLHHNANSREIP